MISLLLITVQAASVIFFIVTVKGLYAYINKYRFDESLYHFLFGFVHMKHLVYMYAFFVLLFLVVSAVFLIAMYGK